MKKLLLSIFVLLTAFAVSAQAQQCSNAPEEFRVFFGNGILNTQNDAEDSKALLSSKLGSTYNSQKITYDLAYNYSDSAYIDLLQSFDQQLGQYSSQLWLWLYDVGVVPTWYKDFRQRLNIANYQINSSELTDHVAKFKEAILQGQKVLVVSHSQGNFYVNEAKQILAAAQPAVPMGSFGIFGVASPANNVGGASGPYLTNHIDMITLVPSSLPANWTLKRTIAGTPVEGILSPVAAHSFTGAYMNAKFDIAPALVGGIKNQMSLLVDPPTVVKSGPVTATMSWDLGSTDVDLHIYEPDASHVYYLNTKGTSGFLDLDNISGYGPEHYYTDCNQLQVGEYVFALNYFRDRMDEENNVDDAKPTRPVTSNVTITVPGATRTFNLTMSSDIDVAGNNAPTKVAKVVVEKIVDPNPNVNGKLKYKIVPL
jgi:hypothetical protein